MTAYPFSFDANACQSCKGHCCRGGSGYVWVDDAEIKAIFNQLNAHSQTEQQTLANRYLRTVNNRISLREQQLGDEYVCCFFNLETHSCNVYNARPHQCRTYPYWSTFKNAPQQVASECPGIQLVNL